MKKLITSLVTLLLVLSLAACGSGDNKDNNKEITIEKVPKTTKTLEDKETSGVPGGRTVSGFDTKTNKTITWGGIDFSFPSYFDVLDKGSTETWKTYYPKEEDYYASILFQIQEFSGTQEDFNSQIPSIVKSTLDTEYFANKEIQKSEKISIAGLSGWTITYSESDTDGDGVISTGSYSFAYNVNNGKVVMISCVFDSNDKSQYDYLGDYVKVLKTAKLLNDSLNLNAIEEILTVENNEELATILSTKDETSPLFKKFAEKYVGRTIEFDGNTANVIPYGDYKTRFNYLIFAGDYSTTTFTGPNFQFRNVDYYDLHLTGDNIPDPFGVGHNIRITAKVVEYDEDQGLFLLEPVSIKMR